MRKYVLGFMFDPSCMDVALILKKRPAWQSGLFNGIGGKIKDGETSLDAMVREFEEESGVDSSGSGWRQFCVMEGIIPDIPNEKFKVYCFCCKDNKVNDVRTQTDEEVMLCKVHSSLRKVHNLSWLIPLAIDYMDSNSNIESSTITYKPSEA